jgi:hypothetical protein
MSYEQQKTSALTHLAHLHAGTAQLQELLTNAKSIRHEGYGTPYWVDAIRKATDYIGQALAEASRKASVT